jgi:hypothetical protein
LHFLLDFLTEPFLFLMVFQRRMHHGQGFQQGTTSLLRLQRPEYTCETVRQLQGRLRRAYA